MKDRRSLSGADASAFRRGSTSSPLGWARKQGGEMAGCSPSWGSLSRRVTVVLCAYKFGSKRAGRHSGAVGHLKRIASLEHQEKFAFTAQLLTLMQYF